MITFKAVIIPNNRRKDGTYPVKIRVTFKGVSRRLATTLVCTANDLTRSLRIKSPDILNKSDELIRQMRNAVQDLSPFDLYNKDVDWVVSRIRDALTKENFQLDFFVWADKFIETKVASTKTNYETALNAFARFLGRRKVDINSITRTMLLDFMESTDNEPKMFYDHHTKEYKKTKFSKTKGTSSRYISCLAHIYNSAKDRYNDEDADRILIPKSPFSRLQKNKVTPVGQRNIGLEVMQKMICYETDNERERLALDVFIVSFGLMGANMADLYASRPFREEWIYNRAKTKDRRADRAEMRIEIPVELKPYLDRLKGDSRHWLCLASLYSTKDVATTCINRALKGWCKTNGIEPFTFYAARHTWSSLARNVAKIEKALIDECLCHKGTLAMADVYIEKDFSLMTEANRKVLDLFEW